MRMLPGRKITNGPQQPFAGPPERSLTCFKGPTATSFLLISFILWLFGRPLDTYELITLRYSDKQNRHGPCPHAGLTGTVPNRVRWLSLQRNL